MGNHFLRVEKLEEEKIQVGTEKEKRMLEDFNLKKTQLVSEFEIKEKQLLSNFALKEKEFNLKEQKLREEIENLTTFSTSQESKYTEEIQKYQSTSSILTEELSQLSSIIEQTKSERLHKENYLQEQLNNFKEKSEKMATMAEKLEIQLKQSEDHSNKLEKERDSLASQCEANQKKMAKLEQELMQYAKDIEIVAELHDKIQQLKADLDLKAKELEIVNFSQFVAKLIYFRHIKM